MHAYACLCIGMDFEPAPQRQASEESSKEYPQTPAPYRLPSVPKGAEE